MRTEQEIRDYLAKTEKDLNEKGHGTIRLAEMSLLRWVLADPERDKHQYEVDQ
jgi:hypothetical protein